MSSFFVEQARDSFHKARDVLEEDEVITCTPCSTYFPRGCQFHNAQHQWAFLLMCYGHGQVLISNYGVEFTGRHEHADDFTWWVPQCTTVMCPTFEVLQDRV